MSGWDRDESGDYTPPPLPPWIGYAVLCGLSALFLLAALAP